VRQDLELVNPDCKANPAKSRFRSLPILRTPDACFRHFAADLDIWLIWLVYLSGEVRGGQAAVKSGRSKMDNSFEADV
jgi:hypothetical protein